MLLRYFYHEPLAHASYLVGCQATGEALVVDPGRNIEPYVQAAAAQGLKLTAAVETHIHADYVTGARELAERFGVRLYLPGEDGTRFPYAESLDHVLLKDGDTFHVGKIRLEAVHTPGHTPEHLSYLLTDGGADRPMGMFTGDFVFVGDVGRPDLLEKSVGKAGTAKVGARQMFRSLQRFKELPDYLQVWPAHGAGSACGKALGAVPSSTVGYEKMFNWALSYTDEEEFVSALLEGQPDPPRYFAVMKRINREGPAPLRELAEPVQFRCSAAGLEEKLKQGIPVLDTRPAEAFAKGHVPGTIHIPYNRSFVQWVGRLTDVEQPLCLIADPPKREAILRDLRSIGADHVPGIFDTACIRQWQKEGVVTEPLEQATPGEIHEKAGDGKVQVLDVRWREEWEKAHIPGARHIPLDRLPERIGELERNRPVVVYCKTGGRSAIACSILKAEGFGRVINLRGGFDRWAGEGLPTE